MPLGTHLFVSNDAHFKKAILSRYLRREINRDKAIDLAGIDWVELAERRHRAMMEDLEWAMGN